MDTIAVTSVWPGSRRGNTTSGGTVDDPQGTRGVLDRPQPARVTCLVLTPLPGPSLSTRTAVTGPPKDRGGIGRAWSRRVRAAPLCQRGRCHALAELSAFVGDAESETTVLDDRDRTVVRCRDSTDDHNRSSPRVVFTTYVEPKRGAAPPHGRRFSCLPG